MLVSKISSFLLGLKILSPRGLLLPFRLMLGHGLSGVQEVIYDESVHLGLVLKGKISLTREGRESGLRRHRSKSPEVDNDRTYL